MLTDPLRDTAAAWLAAGRPAALVQVVQARGSVPRGEGTRMLVSADAVAGTIGGGHLEQRAIEAARRQLAAAGVPRPTPSGPHDGVAAGLDTRFDTRFDTHYPLGPALGQCCGGAVTLRTQPLDAAALAAWPQPEPRFWVQLHGAGHVGRAIVRLLATLPCHVQWVDERESEFPLDALPPHIERICVDAVEAEVRSAPRGAYVLVMTHSHALDQRIVEAALRRDDLGAVGMIGSATKRTRFVRRLAERGLPAPRLHCPIGLPGITGKAPEVIAVAVAAQLLQWSAGHAVEPAADATVADGTRPAREAAGEGAAQLP